jgi:AraC family transcriptional regulator of adaptative response / DNA-3-methyladenine glycosylase II
VECTGGARRCVRIRPIGCEVGRYTDVVAGVAAVVTTRIYCLPACSARPRADHVQRFPLAAAAEAAGYRACYRCRPYRSPPVLSASMPELVCRAVRLILDGALDGGTEAQLGARLGVSGRHLRRLFVAHLGVSPDGLARSARAHFARRLLDDTDLTFTEIAYATGFGSVRQFNRTCRQVFKAPPSALRARRRAKDRLVTDGGLIPRLAFAGPLDWDAILAQLGPRAIPGVEAVGAGVYRRTVVIGGHPGVLELLAGGGNHLLLRAHLPHWEELIHVVARARRIASLDLDIDAATSQLVGDPLIAPLLKARPGLRPPGTWDPFETGVQTLAGGAIARLVQRLGTPVPGLRALGLTHTFPDPAAVAAADLPELGLAPTRAKAVRAFARAVAADQLRLDGSVGLDQLVESLTTIEGIGPTTAHYLALRSGEPDAFPTRTAGDIGALAERWRPWRALAATHLAAAGPAVAAHRAHEPSGVRREVSERS